MKASEESPVQLSSLADREGDIMMCRLALHDPLRAPHRLFTRIETTAQDAGDPMAKGEGVVTIDEKFWEIGRPAAQTLDRLDRV
jgi:hypothetical protein